MSADLEQLVLRFRIALREWQSGRGSYEHFLEVRDEFRKAKTGG